MDVVVYLILPFALTVAWVSVWMQAGKVTTWFFIHAISACLACLLLAVLLNRLHPPASSSIEDTLSNNEFWIPFLNALAGFGWTLVLAITTAAIAGTKQLLRPQRVQAQSRD